MRITVDPLLCVLNLIHVMNVYSSKGFKNPLVFSFLSKLSQSVTLKSTGYSGKERLKGPVTVGQ